MREMKFLKEQWNISKKHPIATILNVGCFVFLINIGKANNESN